MKEGPCGAFLPALLRNSASGRTLLGRRLVVVPLNPATVVVLVVVGVELIAVVISIRLGVPVFVGLGFRPTKGERVQRELRLGNRFGKVGNVLGGWGIFGLVMGKEISILMSTNRCQHKIRCT